ncbi:MAG: hypothetical protein FRX48_09290 [Lasallia pustulata]|uniref:Uncharacterized protein n=1 Tax=Lasallia pustulata TaxID=136370 RepID=A0A5M8PE60_9LECA|nr:MAG: hypothetical protein FRX48_09290 [Lasallia pustulata]
MFHDCCTNSTGKPQGLADSQLDPVSIVCSDSRFEGRWSGKSLRKTVATDLRAFNSGSSTGRIAGFFLGPSVASSASETFRW